MNIASMNWSEKDSNTIQALKTPHVLRIHLSEQAPYCWDNLCLQRGRWLSQPIMSWIWVQWQTYWRSLRDNKPPCSLNIGTGGKEGWDGPLVGICCYPPSQQVTFLSWSLHDKQPISNGLLTSWRCWQTWFGMVVFKQSEHVSQSKKHRIAVCQHS